MFGDIFDYALDFYFPQIIGEKMPDMIMKPVYGKNGLYDIITPNWDDRKVLSFREIDEILRKPLKIKKQEVTCA